MSASIQPPETDLLLPRPAAGETWDPHTIHTHYFGFCVPEAEMGVFLYIRYQPAFPLCQGGVLVFQGMDNILASDMTFQDYEMTMAWPTIEGNKITTPNGFSVEFLEPGRQARLTYRSADDEVALDVTATALTPLAARGHIWYGEEQHLGLDPGGSEQFMHYVGEITVRGERHAVDCNYARDRSWRQVRKESRTANCHPGATWTPIYFDEDLAVSQMGFEDPESDPVNTGPYSLPVDGPLFQSGWVSRDGEVRGLSKVRRNVTEVHPVLGVPTKMELQIEDSFGETYYITGEAIAMTPIPCWPNLSGFDSVYRWEDDRGRVAYATAQSGWNEHVQHALKARRGAVASA